MKIDRWGTECYNLDTGSELRILFEIQNKQEADVRAELTIARVCDFA